MQVFPIAPHHPPHHLAPAFCAMGRHVALLAALAASSPLSSSSGVGRLAELVPQGHSFPGNNVSVNHLKHALPLPKVHYSWALPPGQFESIDVVDKLLVDYGRVVGALRG